MSVQRTALLAEATIEVRAEGNLLGGTGILVAPGVALTSANLVGRLETRGAEQVLLPSEQPIRIHCGDTRADAQLAGFLPYVDLAILEVDLAEHRCVYIDAVVRDFDPSQSLFCFGFTPGDTRGRVCFPSVSGFVPDTETRRLNLTAAADIDLSLFTGAGLLNERTGGVCAMVVGAKAVNQADLLLRAELRHYLLATFSRDELATLCFDLGFTLEHLPAHDRGLERVALELIRAVDARGHLPALIAAASAARSRSPFYSRGVATTSPIEPDLAASLRIVQEAYRQQQVGAVELAGLLGRPDLGFLAAAQRSYHATNTAWVRTFSVEQRRAAGPCYPDDVGPPQACPYPGLRPFKADEAHHFYGREVELAWLIRHLGGPTARLLVITGASGSGKSSLVRAGLLPELQTMHDHVVLGGEALRLGITPLTRLREALALEPGTEADPVTATRALLRRHGVRRMVIVVDQFEDLLVPVPAATLQVGRPDSLAEAAEDERRCALALLRALKETRELPMTLVLVVRSEQLPALEAAGLAPSEELTLRLGGLSPDGLRAAIRRPAEEHGVDIEWELVEQLVLEAGGAANPLPPVQVALAFLWSRMRGYRLTRAAYDAEVVSLAAAVQRQADATLANLSAPEQLLARNMLIRLVDLRERGPDVRRPQREIQLVEASADPASARLVLDELVQSNLLVRDGVQEDVWIELSHDALIGDWGKLRDRWLGRETGTHGGNSLRRCEEERRGWEREVAIWKQSGKRQLLTDPRSIERGAAWAEGCGHELGPVPELDAFIAASRSEYQNTLRRRRALLVFLFAFFLLALFVFYLFFVPILPA